MKERDAETVRAYARIEAMFDLGSELVRRAKIEKAALDRRLELAEKEERLELQRVEWKRRQEARVSRDPDDGP